MAFSRPRHQQHNKPTQGGLINLITLQPPPQKSGIWSFGFSISQQANTILLDALFGNCIHLRHHQSYQLASCLSTCGYIHDSNRYTSSKARVPAPVLFVHDLILRSCYYSMHVEGLLPANLCVVTLLSSEQYS